MQHDDLHNRGHLDLCQFSCPGLGSDADTLDNASSCRSFYGFGGGSFHARFKVKQAPRASCRSSRRSRNAVFHHIYGSQSDHTHPFTRENLGFDKKRSLQRNAITSLITRLDRFSPVCPVSTLRCALQVISCCCASLVRPSKRVRNGLRFLRGPY